MTAAASDLTGIVLAAGEGKRLRPVTDDIPKTLAPVDGDTTILDLALANLSAAGIASAHVVVGYAADAVERRRDQLAARHGIAVELIHNDRIDRNNAYSLWLARDVFARGALIVNGDTVHPVEVERRLLAARGPGVLIALDDVKSLAEEEMKVVLDGDGRLARITKQMDPVEAAGEYIGLTVVEQTAAAALADALEATWRRDPGLYYEDGFQAYADAGGEVRTVSVGGLDWVEVDTLEDLTRARELVCRS